MNDKDYLVVIGGPFIVRVPTEGVRWRSILKALTQVKQAG